MSFFKKLKDRLFKSSSKIDEGLEAIVHEGVESASESQNQEELQNTNDNIDKPVSYTHLTLPTILRV